MRALADAEAWRERRAARLVRLYPAAWRARYGAEMTALLAADIAERPHSPARLFDVARCGVGARLANAGMAEPNFAGVDGARAGLATVVCAAGTFLAFAVAMWAQLGIGWQWSEPDTAGTTTAVVLMSGAMALFGALAVAAMVPVAWSVVRNVACRRAGAYLWPAVLFVAGATLLAVGARHFGNGWPGTGGHHWAHQGLVPGGVYAFAWAATLSVTSYWAHPGALSSFPTSEVAWMAVSPVALVCILVGAAKTLRRVELSPRALAFEARLAVGACFAMVVCMGAAVSWIADGGSGPRRLFHAGSIDAVGLAVMAGALTVVYRVVRCTRSPARRVSA